MTWLMLLVVLTADDPAPPAFHAGNDELRAYLVEAAEKNPGLQAQYRAWLAAMQEIPQMTALEDPMFSYTQILRSEDENAAIEIEQTFPWFGVLRLEGNKAARMADAQLSAFYAMRNELLAEVKQAYFDYALLAERIRLVEAQAEILKYIEDVVLSKYGVGLALEQELYQVQIEQTELEDQYQGLLQSVPAVAAALNRLLGRPASAELAFPQEIALPPPPPPAPIVLARVRTANPDIAAMEFMAESEAIGIDLARKKGYPNITLGLGYTFMRDMAQNRGKMETLRALDAGRMFRNDPTAMTLTDIAVDAGMEQLFEEDESSQDELMISLKVNVPIWRKKVRAGITQAKERAHRQELLQHDKTLDLEAQARQTYFMYEDAVRRAKLYENDLIPKAQLNYESAVSAYSTTFGADFLEMLNSERMLLEFRLEYAEIIRDSHAAAAMLEMYMGGPWTNGEITVPRPAQTEAAETNSIESVPAEIQAEDAPRP